MKWFGDSWYLICILFISQVLAKNYETKCFVQSGASQIDLSWSCSLPYIHDDCDFPPYEKKTSISKSEINQQTNDFFTQQQLVSILIPLNKSGAVFVIISGGLPNNSLCLYFNFTNVIVPSSGEGVTLHLKNLNLNRGYYNMTGFYLFGKQKVATLLTQESFSILPIISRDRREELDTDTNNCTCDKCFNSTHELHNDAALLRYIINAEDISYCENYFVELWEHINMTKNICEDQTDENVVMSDLIYIGPTRNLCKLPIDFQNIHSGCFLITIKYNLCPRYDYYESFWIPNSFSWPEMFEWNASIILIPRNYDSSIEVRWQTLPPLDHDIFNNWTLSMLYLKDHPVDCRGKNEKSIGRLLENIETDEDFVNNTVYIFTNLRPGYYCAIITAFDKLRCPPYGCHPISSFYQYLGTSTEITTEDEKYSTVFWILLLLTVTVILVGISSVLICYIHHHELELPQVSFSYLPVSQNHCTLETVPILLIWTRYYMYNDKFNFVISAFKDILASYSKCKVFDYLDYASMDKKQRLLLMNDPTEWLKQHLRNPNEKIIFIGTEGSYMRLTEHDNTNVIKFITDDSFDELLFPNAIRFINESRDLMSSDYRRIFHVNISGLTYSKIDSEEEIVPRMRFIIPNHLRSLTLKIRGMSEDVNLPEPTVECLQNLNQTIKDLQIKSTNCIKDSDSWKPD